MPSIANKLVNVNCTLEEVLSKSKKRTKVHTKVKTVPHKAKVLAWVLSLVNQTPISVTRGNTNKREVILIRGNGVEPLLP